jgi:hypothetical protein
MFKDLEEGTVEGWVMWRRFGWWSRFFDCFGETKLDINATIQNRGPKLAFETQGSKEKSVTDKEVELNRWVHLAAVLGRGHAKLYLDGELVVSLPTTGSFKALGNTSRNLLGGHVWKAPNNPVTDTDGSMEEVRVWNVARTQEQIRENLAKSLTGSEPGLVALWNFDDPANPGRDASPNHHDGKLVGNARVIPAANTGVSELAAPDTGAVAAISGRVTDSAGKPLGGVEVRLMRGGRAVGTARSGEDGYYFLLFAGNLATCRVAASSENLEAESTDDALTKGAGKVDLTLRDTLRISGILSDSNGAPRRGVKVEAMRAADGSLVAFAVSNVKGAFALRRLPDDDYTLRAATPQGPVNFENGKVLTVSVDAPAADLKFQLPSVPSIPVVPSAENRVLSLDGKGSHVALPRGCLGICAKPRSKRGCASARSRGCSGFSATAALATISILGRNWGLPICISEHFIGKRPTNLREAPWATMSERVA